MDLPMGSITNDTNLETNEIINWCKIHTIPYGVCPELLLDAGVRVIFLRII